MNTYFAVSINVSIYPYGLFDLCGIIPACVQIRLATLKSTQNELKYIKNYLIAQRLLFHNHCVNRFKESEIYEFYRIDL